MKKVIMNKQESVASYEEVIAHYQKYIYRIVHQYINSFKPYGIYEFDDVYQECLISGYKAYMAYDVEKGLDVITIMNTYIRTGLNYKLRNLKSKQNEMKECSFDEKIELNQDKFLSMYLKENSYANDIDLKYTLEVISKNYNEKRLGCLDFLLGNITIIDLTKKYNVSRAYLYKVKNEIIKDLKNKLF